MRYTKQELLREEFERDVIDIHFVSALVLACFNKRWVCAFPKCVLDGLYGAITKRAFFGLSETHVEEMIV